MGFWRNLLGINSYDPAQRVLPEPYEPFVSTAGIPVADPGSPLHMMVGQKANAEAFWRSQPNLRKVIDFVARNTASIPLHMFERVSDTERIRVRDVPIALALSSPQPRMGAYRFWHGVLSDGLLYDRWCALVLSRDDGGVDLVQVPSWRLNFQTDPLRRVTGIRYWAGDRQDGGPDWEPVDLDQAIYDYGYAPQTAGLSPVQTLRDVLDEAAEAVQYRRDVWENGARVPGYISRPAGPKWEDPQRDRLVKQIRATYGKGGPRAGGLPLLEDGMEIKSTEAFSSKDALDLEGRKLTAIEVASAFHIAPELVGAREGNYSNMREFRQTLYRDSLGPYIKAWEDALNAQLLPGRDGGRRLYIEANVESKLRGSFEEQAAIAQATVGAPTMTRNEYRARMNQPPIAGGDELVTPLNVLIGGQASPQDSGSQNRGPKARVKARADETVESLHASVLVKFFRRQESAVRSRLGAKADEDWWDGERWDRELSDDLMRLATLTAAQMGKAAAAALGFDEGDYDEDRTLAFLRAAAESDAANINKATREAIEDALATDDPAANVARVFEEAKGSRGTQIAVSLVTAASGFATTEAARQLAGDRATKTWRAGSRPRPEHAAINGETVPIEGVFSNGLKWPGAPGPPEQVANCNCSVSIQIP